MVILKLDIIHFGKLKEKEITLRPGMNVITGDNESGKTTIAAFVKAMIFGLQTDSEAWNRFLPYDEDGNYGGGMRVLMGGAIYELSRSFVKGAESCKIVKAADGTEVPEPEAFLNSFLAGMSEQAYEETGFMSQTSFLKDLEKWGPSAEKNEALLHEQEVRAEFLKAKEELAKKKEEFSALLMPEIFTEADEVNQKLNGNLEAAEELKKAYPDVTRELLEQKESYEQNVIRVEEDNRNTAMTLKTDMLEKKKELEAHASDVTKVGRGRSALGTIFMVLSLLLAIASYFFMSSEKIGGMDHPYFYYMIGGFGAAVLFLIIGIILAVAASVKRKHALERLQEMEVYRSASEIAERNYQTYLNNQSAETERVDDKEGREARIRELSGRMETMQADMSRYADEQKMLTARKSLIDRQVDEQNRILKEIRALDLAMESFDRLYSAPDTEETDALSEKASGYLSAIDVRKDNTIRISDGVVTVETNGTKVPVSQLSTSAALETLLAVRLTLFDEADEKKCLPLVLDDVFTNFDADRMNAGMKLLRTLGRQVILFSCQVRERQSL